MGCSSEQPPNMTPTFNLSMLQAIGKGVLDGVPQGMVCVVGGVWTDQNVRQLVQLQQQLTLDAPAAAVGVEDAFLAFEDVQRRAGQSAAFQSRDECLCV